MTKADLCLDLLAKTSGPNRVSWMMHWPFTESLYIYCYWLTALRQRQAHFVVMNLYKFTEPQFIAVMCIASPSVNAPRILKREFYPKRLMFLFSETFSQFDMMGKGKHNSHFLHQWHKSLIPFFFPFKILFIFFACQLSSASANLIAQLRPMFYSKEAILGFSLKLLCYKYCTQELF